MQTETEILLETGEHSIDSLELRALPFSFAKRHGVLIREHHGKSADAVYRNGTSPVSLAEARRFAGVPLIRTRPAEHASLAAERVLNSRTAHSHLSIRT